MPFDGTTVAVIGLAVLFGSILGMRILAAHESAVGRPSGHPSPRSESAVCERGPPSPHSATAVEKSESAVAPARDHGRGEPPAQHFRVTMSVVSQVSEFVDALIADGFCDDYRDQTIHKAYLAWARDLHIEPAPKLRFLSVLAAHPNVDRNRVRVKDAANNVIYKPSGTPERVTVYTVAARPFAVVPEGVALPRKKGTRTKPPRKLAPDFIVGMAA